MQHYGTLRNITLHYEILRYITLHYSSLRYIKQHYATLCNIMHYFQIGGYDGTSRNCLSSVERYNVLTDSWQLVCEMGSRRSGPGLQIIQIDYYLYC